MTVLVVGAGISGLACARALQSANVDVRVVDRGRAVGGRMSGRRLDGRPVDLGASYFTASDSRFRTVVQDWTRRGLAREWTDTFAVADGDGIRESRTGPMRYASPTGLRDLVIDLAGGVDVGLEHSVEQVTGSGPQGGTAGPVTVDGERFDAVVLAMPDPQALRLVPQDTIAARLKQQWEPTIAVALRWSERAWAPDLHGAFVRDSPDFASPLSFIADDGDRRGDGAPVLVAHSTGPFAREHLEHPEGAIAPIVGAVRRILGIRDAPISRYAHRWSFARPASTHGSPYLLEGGIGVCGDSWGEKSSVETAWVSGHELGLAIAAAGTSGPL
ncbi:MAG: hypothetical protein RI885_2371 [Actinomycetota bacterium]|jgi:predicted NAD/FAD-dependent oxidoreductase